MKSSAPKVRWPVSRDVASPVIGSLAGVEAVALEMVMAWKYQAQRAVEVGWGAEERLESGLRVGVEENNSPDSRVPVSA